MANLTTAQDARFRELMGQNSDQWPRGLLTFINEVWDGPRRGDGLAVAVATWVRITEEEHHA